jgi:hypothetical protein
MKTTLVGRAKYFMTFMDDNAIILSIYFLKQKLEALVIFKKFQAMVDINSKRNIRAIRNDNSGEFILKVFKDHCKLKGIQQ